MITANLICATGKPKESINMEIVNDCDSDEEVRIELSGDCAPTTLYVERADLITALAALEVAK